MEFMEQKQMEICAIRQAISSQITGILKFNIYLLKEDEIESAYKKNKTII